MKVAKIAAYGLKTPKKHKKPREKQVEGEGEIRKRERVRGERRREQAPCDP
jgi:hypothetical protein